MAIKCITIFLSEALEIFPSWDFFKTNHLATLSEDPPPTHAKKDSHSVKDILQKREENFHQR
jgi:hypothetical protein